MTSEEEREVCCKVIAVIVQQVISIRCVLLLESQHSQNRVSTA